jgi:hypothetical protein
VIRTARAWDAVGRNDIRGTYRDPLLVMVVVALAAFLVLDEVDAGTLSALRVTPVTLSTFFAYRAITVVVVTTVYVVTTMSCSGLLRPGLVPALIPIGLLAGLSAVVTLLLIITMAGNKIQGLAVVRGLGMLIAGLPCLPWFIHSGWSLAFGVLPPYWADRLGIVRSLPGQVHVSAVRSPRCSAATDTRRKARTTSP